MSRKSALKKRPCRVCRRWFSPDARLGDRQKTCGRPECRREWHRRKCAEWNGKNRDYFRSIHLGKKLESMRPAGTDGASDREKRGRGGGRKPQLPFWEFQEVITIEQYVIVEYLVRLSLRRFQEAMKSQPVEKPG